MSLMQLLTVGRSFRTVQDRPSPYKMTEQCLLPKFGRGAAIEGAFDGLGRERGEPDGLVEKRVSVPVVDVPGKRVTMRNLFKRRRVDGESGRVVQGELALDTVKVVRNDLMESDFEVVPVSVDRSGDRGGVVGRLVGRLFGRD